LQRFDRKSVRHTLGVPGEAPGITRLDRNIENAKVFRAIVLKGPLLPLGMARFNDTLTESDVDAIHTFLVDGSWKRFEAPQSSPGPDACCRSRHRTGSAVSAPNIPIPGVSEGGVGYDTWLVRRQPAARVKINML
jgi:hypothetical protein